MYIDAFHCAHLVQFMDHKKNEYHKVSCSDDSNLLTRDQVINCDDYTINLPAFFLFTSKRDIKILSRNSNNF